MLAELMCLLGNEIEVEQIKMKFLEAIRWERQ